MIGFESNQRVESDRDSRLLSSRQFKMRALVLIARWSLRVSL